MLENAAVMEDGRDRELEEPLRPWGLVLPELLSFWRRSHGVFPPPLHRIASLLPSECSNLI